MSVSLRPVRLATGVLFLLNGALWSWRAVAERHTYGFAVAALFVLAGALYIAGWVTSGRPGKRAR